MYPNAYVDNELEQSKSEVPQTHPFYNKEAQENELFDKSNISFRYDNDDMDGDDNELFEKLTNEQKEAIDKFLMKFDK